MWRGMETMPVAMGAHGEGLLGRVHQAVAREEREVEQATPETCLGSLTGSPPLLGVPGSQTRRSGSVYCTRTEGVGGEAMTGPGLRAGTSAVALPVPLGTPMMGYGAREGVAEAEHDPLHARALYLARSASDLLWVQCDLCLIAPAQAAELRRRIAARTGVDAERILVGCIHTHSGPETGILELLTGNPPPAHVGPLFDAVVEAGAQAHASAAPARLGVGHAEAAIGRNRRRSDGPLDRDLLLVRVDRAGGEPLALVYVHGCHPTALGHDNLSLSADWPAAAGAEIAAALPGVNPIFALGAHADVDPRSRGLLDLGIPGQSLGVSFEETEALGRELGRAAGEAAAAIETHADAEVGIAQARLRIPVHPGVTDPARRKETLAGLRAEALAALGVEDDPGYGTGDLYRLERERTAGLEVAERRERVAKVRHYLRDHTAPRFAGGLEPEIEVQALRLGPARLLAVPLEATVDVGLDWKRRMGSGDAAVLSIANGWLRYLPHPRNFAEPGAHRAYEIVMSSLVPDAATRLLDAGQRLQAELGAGAPAAVRRAPGEAA